MRASCLIVASLFALSASGFAATTSVNSLWTDNFTLTTPFIDSLGVPLTNGGPADGDGAVIQLGYFSGVSTALDPATFGPAEWAAFTPISGDGSANPHFATSMGDGGGGFIPDGFYSLGVTWDTAPTAQPTPSSGLPAGPARIGIRYFDGTSVASSTGFNTVTANGTDWVMNAPSDTPTSPKTASLDAAPVLFWEFSENPFQTIPEPTLPLLGVLGLATLLRRRRS